MKIAIILAAAAGLALCASCGSQPESQVAPAPMVDLSAK
jgi:hypothetical protein